MTTKDIEKIAFKHLSQKGRYIIFEVAVPRALQDSKHRNRIDMIMYDTSGAFRGLEIKRDIYDFHSPASWSWICNYNYFIMPDDLYEVVKDEIPDGIGVWVINKNTKSMKCVVRPEYKELLCSKEDMLIAMMQGFSREYKKYRQLKKIK